MTLDMRVAQEEIFGPVTGIVEVGSLEDALRAANSTRYGLSLSLYTRDITRAFRAIEELEAGIVYINLPTSGAEIQLPFGGVKDTGNGHREAGWMAMDYCTEWKSVYVNYSAVGRVWSARRLIRKPSQPPIARKKGGGKPRPYTLRSRLP